MIRQPSGNCSTTNRFCSQTRSMRWLVGLSFLYLSALFGWLLLSRLFGDRWWWLFLLNSVSLYLFLPLPAIMVVALVHRQRPLLIGGSAASILWGILYGGLLLPSPMPPTQEGQELTVMSYNMFFSNQQPEEVVAAIHTINPDIVALQELNHTTAAMLRDELQTAYPYQVFDPQPTSDGMGVISRYPLHLVGEPLRGRWPNRPQILALNFNGVEVRLLNVHLASTSILLTDDGRLSFNPVQMHQTIRHREQQAQAIAEFVARTPFPSIVAGDFNTTDQSRTYTILTPPLPMHGALRGGDWGTLSAANLTPKTLLPM